MNPQKNEEALRETNRRIHRNAFFELCAVMSDYTRALRAAQLESHESGHFTDVLRALGVSLGELREKSVAAGVDERELDAIANFWVKKIEQ